MIRFLLLLPLLLDAQDDPDSWFYFSSREGDKPPRIVVDGAKEAAVAADTVLISYLADRPWPKLPMLSVMLNDNNRPLLRFDLTGIESAKKAELVLDLKLSEMPPSGTVEIALHAVTSEWDEEKTCWNTPPTYDPKPAMTARLPMSPGEIRLDVSNLVRKWIKKEIPNHGILIRVAKPIGGGAANVEKTGSADRKLGALLSWEKTAEEALKKAADGGRLILAWVQTDADPSKPTVLDQMLLACAIADPDLLNLVRSRFVPLRISYSSLLYYSDAPPQADPLKPLGSGVKEVKAPALLVSDAAGKTLGILPSIGTYDPELIAAFLRRQLTPASGDVPWKLLAEGNPDTAAEFFSKWETPEGRYGLCRVAAVKGNHEEAVKQAEAVTEGPFALEAHVQAGASLMRLERFDEARAELEKGRTAKDRGAEALYLLARLHLRAKEPEKAQAVFERVAKDFPDSTWAAKSEARLAWSDRMAIFETHANADGAATTPGTERSFERKQLNAVADRAVDYLLSSQLKDGSWPLGEGEEYRAAIASLAARALYLWADLYVDERKKRASGAVERATEWLLKYLETASPESANSWSTAYLLDFLLDRAARTDKFKPAAEKAVALLLGGQCPNGAWSYSYRFAASWKGGGPWPATDKGRVHSMNTGPALLALARALKAGIVVPPEAIDRGKKALLEMREGPAAFTYTHPIPRIYATPEQSIGRASGCEHALWLLGATGDKDVDQTIDVFMKCRKGLRVPVKLTPGWIPPYGVSSYFYGFSYYHAARLIADRGGEESRKKLGELCDDLLGVVEADGTWVDYELLGKPYSTAAALLVLRLAQ